MRWDKVTLVGVGLLGGSLGLALRRRRLAGQVVGLVRREASIAECLRSGAADSATLDLAAAVAGADLVVLGTPLGQMEPLVRAMQPHLRAGTRVTDVGSVKGPLVAALEPRCAEVGACFVGSHPMAGSERTGVAHSRADLFEHAVCVVTPTEHSDPGAVAQVEALWRSVGGRVCRMAAERHDELVSRSSHLPHMMAASLVQVALGAAAGTAEESLCATGFRDATRVASGSPEMWRDIALMNRLHLGRALESIAARVTTLKAALSAGDAAALEEYFREARDLRDAWLEGFEGPGKMAPSGE